MARLAKFNWLRQVFISSRQTHNWRASRPLTIYAMWSNQTCGPSHRQTVRQSEEQCKYSTLQREGSASRSSRLMLLPKSKLPTATSTVSSHLLACHNPRGNSERALHAHFVQSKHSDMFTSQRRACTSRPPEISCFGGGGGRWGWGWVRSSVRWVGNVFEQGKHSIRQTNAAAASMPARPHTMPARWWSNERQSQHDGSFDAQLALCPQHFITRGGPSDPGRTCKGNRAKTHGRRCLMRGPLRSEHVVCSVMLHCHREGIEVAGAGSSFFLSFFSTAKRPNSGFVILKLQKVFWELIIAADRRSITETQCLMLSKVSRVHE